MRSALGTALALAVLCAPAPGAPSAPAPAPAPGTYWQERACTADHRWCVDWIRVLDDGRLQVRCTWRGLRAQTDTGYADGAYLTDPANRRYEPVATSGAVTMGAPPRSTVAAGTLTFPAPAGAGAFALHDGELVIRAIVLDPSRRSSAEQSGALLGNLLGAETIEVRDGWSGLGGSRNRRVRLARGAEGGFDGLDTLGATRRPPTPAPAPRGVRLRKEEARRFLATLAGSAAIEGIYRPRFERTDDYPRLSIAVTVRGAVTTFETESQGKDHTPWALRTEGRALVVPSSHPARALRFLRSVLDGKPAPEALEEPDDAPRPLRLAAQRGDVGAISRLLARGARPEERTPYDGETALTAAARWGQADSVRLLLEKGADPTFPNAAGSRAVVLASQGGHADVVRLLAGSGGSDALVAAATSGSSESVDVLLAAGVAAADAGEALYQAAAHGSTAAVRSLVAAQAPVNDWKHHRGRPLDGALDHGHLETARLLVAAGADLTGGDKQWPPLLRAACVGHVDLIQLLLGAGADVRAASPTDGRTALFLARTPAVAAMLLKAGADVNARRLDGATPLAALTDGGCGLSYDSRHPRREPPASDALGTARTLLDAGAALDARDNRGATALQRAVAEPLHGDNRALAVLLLERGADPNAADPNGVHPLWRALETYAKFENAPGATAQEPVIRALVKAGARNLPNRSGATPRDFAANLRDPARLLALLSDLKP
jgi:uncharacterized protein